MARVCPISTIEDNKLIKEIQMSELRVIEKLDEVLQMLKGKQPSDKWMDLNDVVDYSSMSRSSIFRSCKEGRLKYSGSHGKFLFRKSDVERWIKNG